MLLKSSVFVYAAPCGWKYEIDAVARVFKSIGRTESEIQISQGYGVLPIT